MEDIIKLNVGGRIFVTKRCTLCACPDSLLGRMFDPDSEFAQPAEIDGCVFLDRDPDMFTHVLQYLRKSCDHFRKMSECDLYQLRNEADYYGFPELREELQRCIEKIEERTNEREEAFKEMKDYVSSRSEPLPPGWEELVEESGRPYYYSDNTGERSWARPRPTSPVDHDAVRAGLQFIREFERRANDT